MPTPISHAPMSAVKYFDLSISSTSIRRWSASTAALCWVLRPTSPTAVAADERRKTSRKAANRRGPVRRRPSRLRGAGLQGTGGGAGCAPAVAAASACSAGRART